MTKQLPDFYLYFACYRPNPTARFKVLDVYRFTEDHVFNCSRDLLKPSRNIAYLATSFPKSSQQKSALPILMLYQSTGSTDLQALPILRLDRPTGFTDL